MKTTTLSAYARAYGLNVLVETGLDQGRGSGMDVNISRYVAIDYQQANVDMARASGFDARCGDSSSLLSAVLAELNESALIWLDAHGLDCGSQHPVLSEHFPGWELLPLLDELRAVAAWPYGLTSVVLIDDMPVIAQWVGVGLTGEPTTAAFESFLDHLEMPWYRFLHDGILRLTPPNDSWEIET